MALLGFARDAAPILDPARRQRRAKAGGGEALAGELVIIQGLLDEDVVVDTGDNLLLLAIGCGPRVVPRNVSLRKTRPCVKLNRRDGTHLANVVAKAG